LHNQKKKEIIVMATVSATKDDIKSDVKELVDIVVEDAISQERIDEYSGFAEIKRKDMLQWKLDLLN
jgi:hypothetical protein